MFRDAACGLLAVSGVAAILHSGDASAVAALTFLLAAALSCLRPQLSAVCPLLCAGAVGAAEIWNYAGAASGSPFSMVLATALALGIAVAGAGAGRNLSVLDLSLTRRP
jgi:hypothetical protein